MKLQALVISLAGALLLGLLAGNFLSKKYRAVTQFSIVATTRKPIESASTLAFRFGSPDDAKLLLQALGRLPSLDDFTDADHMRVELRLAALDGEHESAEGRSAHIAAALAACQRFRNSGCDEHRLRQLAADFALQRSNQP